jgi:UDP-glucose 4-epimerase
MRCLVTGVAGFIGSHLAEQLISEGHDVLGIDCFTSLYPRELKEANLQVLSKADQFRFMDADLNSLDLLPIVAAQDWIFHQAGQPGVRSSWGQHFATYTSNNVLATQRLLEAAVRAPDLQKLVYASSSSIYGRTADLPLNERAYPEPVSPYGVTKLAAEHLCMLYWHNYGVPVVALRYFTVYGPRQRPDMSFHIFGRSLLTGGHIEIYGDGKQTRDFTYVGDIVQANLLAASAPQAGGKVFNIAGGSYISLADAIDQMQEIARCKADVRYLPTAKGDMRDTFADIEAAKCTLGFAPKTGLAEGLARELSYLRGLYCN